MITFAPADRRLQLLVSIIPHSHLWKTKYLVTVSVMGLHWWKKYIFTNGREMRFALSNLRFYTWKASNHKFEFRSSIYFAPKIWQHQWVFVFMVCQNHLCFLLQSFIKLVFFHYFSWWILYLIFHFLTLCTWVIRYAYYWDVKISFWSSIPFMSVRLYTWLNWDPYNVVFVFFPTSELHSAEPLFKSVGGLTQS